MIALCLTDFRQDENLTEQLIIDNVPGCYFKFDDVSHAKYVCKDTTLFEILVVLKRDGRKGPRAIKMHV